MMRPSAVLLALLASCTAGQIEQDSAAVISACNRVMPLAQAAAAVPVYGTYVALGVTVGCGTASGIAKLTADPSSAEWLAQQERILATALSRRG